MFCYRSYRHSRRKRQRLLTLALPVLALLTLTLPFYIIYKPPHLLISYFVRKYPDILWEVPTLKPGAQPIVALTIDDAPTQFTPQILSLLRKHDAKATFFLIGNQIPGREWLMRDAINEGHELANHALYDERSKDRSDQELAAQMQAVQSQIQRIYAMAGRQAEAHDEVKLDDIEQDSLFASGAGAGSGSGSGSRSGSGGASEQQPRRVENDEGQRLSEVGESIPAVPGGPARYFRPGSGIFTDRMRALVQREGFRLVLGSVYPHDPQVSVPWVNAAHILSMVRPGSIIIVHDRRSWTPETLSIVLPELKKRGYRVGTVTDLLKEGASITA
ncbi:hypothetical protein BDW62DRAFT_178467 [Aspergillus aurantiobrunneus]